MDVYNDSGITKYTVEWLGLNRAESFEYAESSLKLWTALHARKVLKSSGNVAYGPVKQAEYAEAVRIARQKTEENKKSHTEVFKCSVCEADDEEDTVQCDGCDLAFHFTCVFPALTAVSEDDEWYCCRCESGRQQLAAANAAPANAEEAPLPQQDEDRELVEVVPGASGMWQQASVVERRTGTGAGRGLGPLGTFVEIEPRRQ